MSNNTTPIQLKFKTTINHPGELPEIMEIFVDGSYMLKDGKKVYIQYEEILNDKTMRTTLRFDESDGIIMRNGDIKMRLPFVKGYDQRGHYTADFGEMPIIVRTHHIDNKPLNDEVTTGELTVRYELIVSGESVGEYTLEYSYTEGK
ncbi:DUF1934 domain-containing protein [Kurthia massiliensis]|uniref:DUF1934 domain-containing protein n=1 Tax=Kurthia massiliensis TaxID=1033739 RepID=UPI00028A04A9|nr:DUF1934 domain-containing protein [Kurthia massiliensis]